MLGSSGALIGVCSPLAAGTWGPRLWVSSGASLEDPSGLGSPLLSPTPAKVKAKVLDVPCPGKAGGIQCKPQEWLLFSGEQGVGGEY